MQPQLIEAIDRRLAPDGLVFLQSDVMEVSCTAASTCSGSAESADLLFLLSRQLLWGETP